MNSRSIQLTEQAMAHHHAGRLQQALPLYQQAIAADKSNSDAHQFMGLLFIHAGQPEQGITCIRNAIAINPKVAPYHDNLGAALESVNDFEGALASYQSASDLDQDSADRLFGKANALAALARSDESEEAYRAAIALNPNDSAFYFNLGNLLKSVGKLAEACECYRQASGREPEIEGVLTNWGNTLLARRDLTAAISILEKAVSKNSKNTEAHIALASAYLSSGDSARAKREITVAESLLTKETDRTRVTVFNLKGKHALQTASYQEAIAAYRQVLRLEHENLEALNGLASTFRWIQPRGYEPELVADIERLFDCDGIAAQRFSRLAANQIRQQLSAALLRLQQPGDQVTALSDIAANDLLNTYLTKVTNTDSELETGLVHTRRALLEIAGSGKPVTRTFSDFASSLAIQLFLNEHVYVTSENERSLLSALSSRLTLAFETMAGDRITTETEYDIAVLATFEPLIQTQFKRSLLELDPNGVSEAFAYLIQLAVIEPEEEAQIKQEIVPLVQIDDSVSAAVRAQYEQHPYPRWFHLTTKSRVSYYDYLDSLFPHYIPSRALANPVSVLSAGCGTGQEAAMICSGKLTSEVVGLDLSATSLAHAQRMATKLQLENIRFVQGDILKVAELGRTFPVIETTGVLHHLGDPVTGWQALTGVLQEQGLMKVGLYSTRASQEVENARAWIQEREMDSDDETIKKVRQEIFSLDKDHPQYALRHSEDFYSVSACRDLIFHVQERSYTPAELIPILERLSLEFIGFELPDESTRLQYLKLFPDDTAMTHLKNWDQYDERYPDTFSGMLVFWCQRR